ncbi:Hypothetical predicted protein [Cloeon dipterum]|uniref:AAA+ ATPase domain-containing protein n=1 Tax=Cloeon dipterum TaxID=197152 RepID=A0A8S1E1Z8_9INSE|nr:Hypothetical predicted protein [Cloeon dipterum]
MEPNWDFRACSIYPTHAEVAGDVKAPLKANVVDGPFENVEQYLETHFWLMREEVVGPLRKKVNQIKRNRGNVECPPYMKAKFLRPNNKIEKLKGVKVSFTENGVSNEDSTGEKSQSLKHGSLVCFTCNSFETLFFATISNRDEKYIKKSLVFVEFTAKSKEDIFNNEYIMIESETFFGPYEHVLKALQRTEDFDFPFPQYFIGVSKSDALPKYKRNSSKTISIEGVDQDFTSVRLLEPNSWPTAAEIGLDESQLISLQAALTRELAFILGPPGTGKTYVGLTVAQILIENKAALNLKKPILVISSTNHSLDRFLIELLNLTDNFVRIGQQSKFSQLNPYNYNKLEGTWFERLAYQDVIGMTATKASEWRPKLNALSCEVVIVEDSSVLFDAQLFACLSKNCQHLIMIGGEKQLQPKLEDPDLASLNMNVSFFKRMLDNRESQKPLRYQYRMPPEITKLISPLIYPEMKHNSSMLSMHAPELLTKRVYFVTHNYPESPEEIEVRTPELKIKQWKSGNSKKNDQEASFVVALCKYLLLQKVAPLDVTILTTYSCQSATIKKLIKEEKKVEGLATVEVATVDNFQGGENKFIILSLVRSNSCGALGFLDEEHRIGVALSKTQNTLIIIGNMATLSSKSSIWRSIRQTLDEQDAINSWLELRCTTYPTGKHLVFMEELDKFERICSESGCTDPHRPPQPSVLPNLPAATMVNSYARRLISTRCGKRKSCGHICRVVCPPDDDHTLHRERCLELCLRMCRAGLHECQLQCNAPCKLCLQTRQESNWDFRTCSIYPTYDEVVGVVKAPLKANVVDGPFKSVEQYLETHFWLMREEVVGPLRQKVDQIKRNRGNVECPPYMTAQFLRSNAGHEKSKGYKLKITNVQSGSDKDTAELQSQSLMHGSLVCFTCNSFETLIFATISYRDKNFMEKSQVFVKFLSKFKEDIFTREYIMIESGTFFWSYEQVLQVIQRTEANDFPFPQYFIEVSKGDALPRYMRESSKTISIKGVDQDFASVQLLQPNSWPTAAEIGLDESQLLSLQAALTRELAFILGPPGTGKTYVGLTVAQILIENKAALNLKKPILVISSTNHSLDRFLIELLNLTDNFVRIGQQSKFPQLNPYNYNKLEGTWYERLAYQDVIGMTASKASEWRPKLTALGCEVVIIEDASVLFDAQLFACLPKNCQHLIMIGGEKQLQPKLKNPDDLASFNLNVSFFKRMLDNRGSQKPLRFQYRMPPEMTKLISPLIYPEMKHNANVLSLPVLELLPNRVSFVTHNYPESPEEIEVRTPEQNIKHWKTGNSKKNYQEASFVVALCKYLLLQKVAPLDVTILTTYLSQSDLIKKLIKEEKSKARGLASVDVATVDNFQGGENKFIILSLVRSNSCGALGFLDEEHRIGVALSKAQNALIIIGNMGTLSSRSSNWCSIKQTLDEQDLLNSWLELRCMANPLGKHLVTLEELDKFERICTYVVCIASAIVHHCAVAFHFSAG